MSIFGRKEELITNAPLDSRGERVIQREVGRMTTRRVETAGEIADRLRRDPKSHWKKVRVVTPAHTRSGEVLCNMGAVMGRRKKRFLFFTF